MSRPEGFLSPQDVRAYRHAHKDARTTRAGHLVLTEMERCQRKYKRLSPSVEGLAKACECSPRTVLRATKVLREIDRLDVWRDRPFKQSDGTWRRKRTNLYRVRFPRNPRSHRGDNSVTSSSEGSCRDQAGAPGPVDLSVVEVLEPPPDEAEVLPTVPPRWVVLGLSNHEWIKRGCP